MSAKDALLLDRRNLQEDVRRAWAKVTARMHAECSSPPVREQTPMAAATNPGEDMLGYSGPYDGILPPPDVILRCEAISPGFLGRLLTEIEEEQRNRHKRRDAILENARRTQMRHGTISAFFYWPASEPASTARVSLPLGMLSGASLPSQCWGPLSSWSWPLAMSGTESRLRKRGGRLMSSQD
jgi:hypothetical protein